MTPMQTLVRLAELTRQLEAKRALGDMERNNLRAERDRIVSAVPSVPTELAGCNDAGLWAHIFEQRYPSTSPPGVIEVWIAAALAGARLEGIKEGAAQGAVAGREQRTAAQGAAVKTLELIAGLLEGGTLPDIRLRGPDPDEPPVKLSAVVAEALGAAL